MTGDEFIRDLVEAMPTPHAKMILAARLVKYAGQTIYLPTEGKRDRRVRAALNMIKNGMTGGEAAQALIERFGVSQRTAQRDVENARNLALKSGGSMNDHEDSQTTLKD